MNKLHSYAGYLFAIFLCLFCGAVSNAYAVIDGDSMDDWSVTNGVIDNSSSGVLVDKGFYQRMVSDSDVTYFQTIITGDSTPVPSGFRGRLFDDSANDPVPDITINIYDQNGDLVATGKTDDDGYYSISVEDDGNYYAVIEVSDNYLGKVVGGEWCAPEGLCDPLSGEPNEYSVGDRNRLNFSGLIINGGVINGVIHSAENDEALSGIQVVAYDSAGERAGSAYSGKNGAYSIAVPDSGSYFIKAISRYDYFGKVMGGDDCFTFCDITAGDSVEVVFRQAINNIDLSLQKAGYISGVVSDATDETPLGNGWFADFSVEVYSNNGYRKGRVFPGSEGRYRYGPLVEGQYFVRANPGISTGYLAQTYGCEDACVFSEATIAFVTEKEALENIDFALEKGGSISGAVRLSEDEGFATNTGVWLFSGSGKFLRAVITDSEGFYRFDGLYDGDYYLRVDSYEDYVGVSYGDTPCIGYTCDPALGDSVSVGVGEAAENSHFSLPKGGSIQGVVSSEDGGRSVAGASVSVFSHDYKRIESIITDDEGSYMLRALPSGDYYLRANSDGFVSEAYDGDVCLDNSGCELSQSQAVSVSPGNAATDINFSLIKAASISGAVTLTDSTSSASGATVKLYSENGQHLKSTHADEHGNYQFENLLGGEYYLLINFHNDHPGSVYGGESCRFYLRCEEAQGTLVATTLGENTANIDFALKSGGNISGVLLDKKSGSPIKMRVTLYDSAKQELEVTYSDAQGMYEFSVLPAGKYFVEASGVVAIQAPSVESACEPDFLNPSQRFCSTRVSPIQFQYVYGSQLFNNEGCLSVLDCDVTQSKPLVVEAGKVITNADFQMEKMGAIEGVVTSQNTAEKLAYVWLQVLDEYHQQKAYGSTNADGEFYIGDLEDGSYFVTAAYHYEYISYVNGGSNEYAPKYTFEIKNGELVSGINLMMEKGMTISGMLVDSVSGEGIPSAYFCLGGGHPCASLDGQGRYIIKGVPPGEHMIWFEHAGDHVAPDTLTAVNVELGVDLGGVDFLLPLGGAISGTVESSATGKRISEVAVDVFDLDGNWVSAFGDRADENGQYRISGLPSGEYFISVYVFDRVHTGEVYGGSQCFRGCDVTSGAVISVFEGQTTTDVDFRLQKGGSVSGVIDAVPDEEPYPYFQLSVRIFDQSGVVVGRATPNEEGEFRSSGLPGGEYYVAVSSNKGVFHTVWGGSECPSGYLESNASCVTSQGSLVSVKQGEESGGVSFAFYEVEKPDALVPPSRTGPSETESGGGGGAIGWPELLLWFLLMSGWFRIRCRRS
ncbi:carboxypeptidase regulatory-like domain-containing protein [Pseudomonadota bacterium]